MDKVCVSSLCYDVQEFIDNQQEKDVAWQAVMVAVIAAAKEKAIEEDMMPGVFIVMMLEAAGFHSPTVLNVDRLVTPSEIN